MKKTREMSKREVAQTSARKQRGPQMQRMPCRSARRTRVARSRIKGKLIKRESRRLREFRKSPLLKMLRDHCQ